MPDDPRPTEHEMQHWFLGERHQDIFTLLKQGIREKRKVLACLRLGTPLVFYPHALGTDNRQIWVRGFLVMEAAEVVGEPFNSPLRWRWFPVADIIRAQLADRWGSLPINPPAPPAGVEITLETSGVL